MNQLPKNIPLTALGLATAALLAACGGGGGSATTGPVTLAGAVIDGYISGATVCLDLNSNGACDAGEPSSTTGTNGRYSLCDEDPTAGSPEMRITNVKFNTDCWLPKEEDQELFWEGNE